MVSKVAVIALVGILAVPILLGYAMNLSEEEVTYYTETGESVNVTPLLQNSTGYTYAHADPFQLNTSFSRFAGSPDQFFPYYVKKSSVKTTFPLNQGVWTDSHPASNARFNVYQDFAFVAEYNAGQTQLNVTIYDGDTSNVVKALYRVHSFYYDKENQRVNYSFYFQNDNNEWVPSYAYWDVVNPATNRIMITHTGTFVGKFYYTYSFPPGGSPNSYVDISSGYYFEPGVDRSNVINLPDHTKSVIITFDLSSITSSSYSLGFGPDYTLQKTTVGGEVIWEIIDDLTSDSTTLFYDPTKSSNTYQLKIWTDVNTAVPTGTPGYYTYERHFDYRYVGDWPSFIGEANYYLNYDLVRDIVATSEPNFNSFFVDTNVRSPIMRVDDAEYRAFEYSVIENKTYTPSTYKSNPSTTLSGLQVYGSSIEFGGNTYTVTKGNITLGSKQISLNGMTFDSVPNPDLGGYDNRIGGTVVSTTEDPSTITFNGKWGLSVSTISMESNTSVKTQWTPGHFGWDGIDSNFLMVGLLTSVGMFIAIGIYSVRTKARLWPALIVCGGAAMLFFVML